MVGFTTLNFQCQWEDRREERNESHMMLVIAIKCWAGDSKLKCVFAGPPSGNTVTFKRKDMVIGVVLLGQSLAVRDQPPGPHGGRRKHTPTCFL